MTQISLVGGVSSLTSIIIAFFVSIISKKLFLASMLRKLFHVKNFPDLTKARHHKYFSGHSYRCDDFLKSIFNTLNCCGFKPGKMSSEWNCQVKDEQDGRNMWENVERRRDKILRKTISEEKYIDVTAKDHIINSLMSRKLFIYDKTHLLKYFG